MTSNTGATEHHQFYGDGANAAAVAVDLSGNGNCTAGATWIYQSSFSPGTPCTAMVEIELESGVHPAGYIFNRYSGSSLMGLRWNGTNAFQVIIGGSHVHALSALGDGRFLMHWSSADDPLNSGQIRSEIRLWDLNTSAFLDGYSFTHADQSVAGSDIIWGAQVTAGTNGTGGTLRGAGFLLHDTSELQVYRDRMTSAAAPTLVGDTAMEVPMPDWSCNWSVQGRAAGPSHYVAAAAVAQDNLMLLSPLVNVQWYEPDPISYGGIQTNAWWIVTPSGSGYMGLPWLWRVPAPRTANYLRCRVFIASGRDGSTTENSVTVTAWSGNRNPGIESDIPLEYSSDSQTFGPVNDTFTGNAGRWVDFDSVRIVRDEDDMTWLWVSVEVTGASATIQTVTIYSVSMEPIADTESDALAEIGSG